MMCETLQAKSSEHLCAKHSAPHGQILARSKHAKSATTQRQKKSVRFSLEPPAVCNILSLDEYSEAEIARCWWNDSECEGARINAQYIATTAKKSPLIRMLEETYMRVQDVVDYAREQDELEESMFHPPSHLTHHLEKWSTVAHSVRGLERWVSKKQRALRGIEACNARDIVLDLYFVVGSTDTEIARAYAEHTRASSTYARLVGHADQEAVRKLAEPPKLATTDVEQAVVAPQGQSCTRSKSEKHVPPNQIAVPVLSKPGQQRRRCSNPLLRNNIVANLCSKVA